MKGERSYILVEALHGHTNCKSGNVLHFHTTNLKLSFGNGKDR